MDDCLSGDMFGNTLFNLNICSNNFLFKYSDVEIIFVQLANCGVGFVQFLPC